MRLYTPTLTGHLRKPRTVFLWLLCSFLFSFSQLQAQDHGKEIFEKNCAICHKISTEKLVGPGLKGVTERHEKAWIKKFIKGSQAMVKSGDKAAVKLFEENGKIPMPDHASLSDQDLDQLIGYIENYKPAEARKVSVDITKKDGFDREDILRGERYFYGVLPFVKGKTLNCASCHANIATDSLNFNPSAYDLAKAWKEPNGTNLYQVLGEPTSTRMAEAHNGLQMSDKEIYDVSAYLSTLSHDQMPWERTFPTRLIVFLLFGLLMALALADLIWFKKLKYRWINWLVLLIGISVHTTMAIQEGINLSRTKNYSPDQPIKFSHKVHAGQNKTDCEYCHSSASFAKSAGIPSSNLCLNCHKVVTQGTRSGKFEINKILRAEASGQSVPWVRIHKLPDHVYFNHSQHVTAGKVKCQECHGKVEEMDIVKQASDLSMGWCVNCHRRTAVQFDNKYYSQMFKTLHDQAKSGKKITEAQLGGIDCAKCHY